MAHLLGAENLHLDYPTRTLFDGVTVGISEGDRIGIVGKNGDGKSSLLRLLTGEITPNSGSVTRRSGVTVGVLQQADSLDEDSEVGETIVGGRAEHDWAGDPKIRDVIHGLVSDLEWHATIGSLSGGQRRRVALASVLVDDFDVLALDEPSNHLDIEGIAWLAAHLKRRWASHQGALLLITHDRWLLDEVCTQTWEVHDGIVEPFEGGYAAYVLQRVERDRIAQATEQKRQNLMRKELAWLRRGAPARTSKPKFRIDAANDLIADVPPVRDSIRLQRLAVARLGKEVVNLDGVSAGYGADNEVLHDVIWKIAPGERTGILGANGAGKSTLLGLIAGTVLPSAGTVKHGKTVQVAVLDQKFRQLEDIQNDRVREVLSRTKTSFEVGGKELTPAQLLERLGFRREQLSTPVGDLSGGQKRRLQLLLILLQQPNVLILDEPTNDVDADMLAAVEDLLDSWPGTLLVVSHDRYLLERVTDQQYAIVDGTLRHLPGGIDQYLDLQRERQQVTQQSGSPLAADRNRDTPANSGSQLTGAKRHQAEKELSSLERRVDKLTKQIQQLHEHMADHDQSDFAGLQELTEKMQTLQAESDEVEERWMEISELLG
jgi:ATP-binding cassette subfamily F protein uup